MEATNFTREQLAQYILDTAKDSVVNKIKKIVSKEQKDDIVAYTVNGEPLNVSQYKIEIQKGLDDIEAGRVTSDNDLTKEIENW
ncbi:hypothetical protein Q4Q34_14225 [Flavivirga abyssicola]|uniref:hypothetical protein n=1 Tax=Flavivirga abyssicola TaxID=3063533 RepID=UPI0026DF23B5|nr:hypothetical protein [Flavivirga sp. MEBiC07777]WVK12379.1 hypothetical protein Q4Q34_14225 [Flavivirga sp. MEBiC07777]